MFGSILGGLLGGLGGIFGGNAEADAAKANRKQLNKLLSQGTAAIDTGHDEAQGYLGGVGDIWKNLADESGGLSGLGLYGDALGVNGAAGNARATSAFQTSPGYDFALNQGLDALERRAGAQGRLSSGQTGLDTLSFAHGLADQDYNNWLSGLSDFSGKQGNIYTGATTGQAGALTDLAKLATGTAGQKVDLMTGVTNGMMGANNQVADAQSQKYNGIFGGLGKGLGAMFGGYM